MEANKSKHSVLEQRLHGHEKLDDYRFEDLNRALKLQAKEYERRLNELNHENERILAAQNKAVSFERYEVEHRFIIEKLNILQEMGSKQRGEAIGVKSTLFYVISVLALLISIAAIILGVK